MTQSKSSPGQKGCKSGHKAALILLLLQRQTQIAFHLRVGQQFGCRTAPLWTQKCFTGENHHGLMMEKPKDRARQGLPGWPVAATSTRGQEGRSGEDEPPKTRNTAPTPGAERPRCERSVTTAATQNINTGAGTSCLYLLLADRNTAVMTLINTPRSSAGWSTVHLLVRRMRTRARQCWRLPVAALRHLRSHHRPPPLPHATCLK